jgi:hypothetical protein
VLPALDRGPTGTPAQVAADVALCVCTRGRPSLLARLLDALERLGLDNLHSGGDGFALALVVCDNGPDGLARALCEVRRPGFPFALAFVEEPEPGISFARNRALDMALQLGASLIAFIDDDDEPQPGWLHRLLEVQRTSGADMVFGTWSHPAWLAPPPLLAELRFFRPLQLDNRNSYDLPAWAGTYNVLLTRRLVEHLKAGGLVFRTEFALTGGSDTDLFIRAHRAGFAHAVATDSVVHRVWEADRMTLPGVVRRAFRIGCTRIQLAQAHKPASYVRKLGWRSARKLGADLARLPMRAVRPPRLAALLVRAAQRAGEVYAALGGRFAYYRTTASDTLQSGPPCRPS